MQKLALKNNKGIGISWCVLEAPPLSCLSIKLARVTALFGSHPLPLSI
jgi:hypothetical protein